MTSTAPITPPRVSPRVATRGVADPADLGPPTSRLLVLAAGILPRVVGSGPVASGDVHTALCQAAGRLHVRDHHDRSRLADQAQMGHSLHGWLIGQSLTSVMDALVACGRPAGTSVFPPGGVTSTRDQHR